MRTLYLVVALGSTLMSAAAWAGTDAGPDCASDVNRCTLDCQCEVAIDPPCNDLPDGALAVSYPTADPVEVLCPTMFISGAHDPETPNNVFYRVELSLDSGFGVLTYDSGLFIANPGTTEHQIAPNGLYPNPTEAGGTYWYRVTDNDDCSDSVAGIYYANPDPLVALLRIVESPTDNCTGGGDADTDVDTDADTDTNGGGGGGGSSGCSTTTGAPGTPGVFLLAALGAIAFRRRK